MADALHGEFAGTTEPTGEPVILHPFPYDEALVTTPQPDPTFLAYAGGVAARLRRAADDVERHAGEVRMDMSDRVLDHSRVAAEIVRDVQVLLGNLDLHTLVHVATRADRGLRRG